MESSYRLAWKVERGYFGAGGFLPDAECDWWEALLAARRSEERTWTESFWRKLFPDAFPMRNFDGRTRIDKEDVKAVVRLSELVGQNVELRMRGHRGQGRCPFHEDRSPSLSVDDEKGVWHCHGCGAGGDVFSYVMKRYDMPFGKSVAFLAELAGLTNK